MKLLLFDVDGTLSRSTLKISPKLLNLLTKLSKTYKMSIVSGGTYEKIMKSIGEKNMTLFQTLLKQALAIDVDARPEWRLTNIIYQRRARWLLEQIDDLIL